MINTQIRTLLKSLVQNGEMIPQDSLSLLKNDTIVESLNTQLILSSPRNRIFFSPSALEMFNPGLAVARFFYLLSGSNLLSDISFYTKSVERFSDDGIHIPGSSYGYRIFNTVAGQSQFDRAAALIMNRKNTKRAAISIYNETDCGRTSKDIPCCLSLVLSPRGEMLNFTVQMRANNIWSLTAYNIFEFSLLFEFLANLTGYKLGTYYHLSTSTHFSEKKLSLVHSTINEIPSEFGCRPMPPVNDTTRERLVQLEKEFKSLFNEFLKKPHLQTLVDTSLRLTSDLDPYWADFYFTLTNYFLSKNGFDSKVESFTEKVLHESHVLLRFQKLWMSSNRSESEINL